MKHTPATDDHVFPPTMSDRYKCCECKRTKHRSNFSRYQLEQWPDKKRCRVCAFKWKQKRHDVRPVRSDNVSKENDHQSEKEYSFYNEAAIMESLTNYKCWKAQDIVNWIVRIDRVRYHKCDGVKLLNNMVKEEIDGTKLKNLTMHGLHRLEINVSENEQDLFEMIQLLIQDW